MFVLFDLRSCIVDKVGGNGYRLVVEVWIPMHDELCCVFNFLQEILKGCFLFDEGLCCCMVLIIFFLFQLPVLCLELSEYGYGFYIGIPHVLVFWGF